MELILNGATVLAATIAAIYCCVLSRKLSRLQRLDDGMGASIATLAKQCGALQDTVRQAKTSGAQMQEELVAQTARAERAAGRLELLLATVHDSKSGESRPVAARPQAGSDLRDIYKAMR
ncbi:hypothetical protein [Pontivivens insulae]|uniref:Uncharacterized protein n=1 Tax=Pontivivens insulae TaxID=1639689 RepID=A0A2R8AAC8_9RHOB|nr:hypothetical protein [Pontivivens insulae]RED12945.1 hypothetical protein DFR53_2079 [Pontivivens insulae]SPF29038.1 hypothetical protein POI8812_01343 [Pontivivens insulae]